ncbi:MAG: paraquat-inducible protein A, partial [Desulfobulbus sp.]|nr:paraquat-inducible protein A [Desulfobulbus sp.]
MATDPSLVACPDCDLLNRLDGPAAATLLCARCGAVLRRHRPDSIDRTLALVVAALLLFALANAFP